MTVTLSDDGGQPVEEYIVSFACFVRLVHWNTIASTSPSLQVEVRGTNHTFLSSEQMQVSLLVNQLRVNFTKGERVMRVFAVNSVGTSDPVSADVTVPCELLYAIYIVHAGLIGAWVVSVYVGIMNRC